MHDKILLVDDDQNLLDSLKRQLRKKFRIETALGPGEGLAAIIANGPFAVIVSDLRMPVMDGIQFLAKAKVTSPASVRIILTGNADLQNTVRAVNKGNIYRFLTKPFPTESLTTVLQQAIRHYRLVIAERELLEKTLKGSINVLTELLSMLSPEAFGRSSRIKRYACQVASLLGVTDIWKIDTAAMLSQVGCITVPEQVLNKVDSGLKLTEEEECLFKAHPRIASDLLSHIPRMNEVADIIANQNQHFDGASVSESGLTGKQIPIGARILKVVLDFDLLESKGLTKGKALKELDRRPGWYDPNVLGALRQIIGDDAKYMTREVFLKELRPGMILSDNVMTLKGQLLISRGNNVSTVLIQRLKNFAGSAGVKEPISVFAPL